jgi:predicted enzyme related to lactoylglutathione lyase
MGQRKIKRKSGSRIKPHKVTINTDGITDEQKRSIKFQSAYQDMHRQLTAPEFAHVLSCHEAAHLFYFRIVGMRSHKVTPARLQYDPVMDDYFGSLASVQILDPPPQASTQNEFEELLPRIARALAAGGVVSRKLMASMDVGSLVHRMDTTGGDQNDKERFVALCQALTTRAKFSVDAETLWKNAQDAVLKDLSEHPEWLGAIETLAAELRPKLGL